MTAFLKAFQSRWKDQTDCPNGYVVEDCKQYQKPKTTTTSDRAHSPVVGAANRRWARSSESALARSSTAAAIQRSRWR